MRIGLVGSGSMGSAIAAGWVAAGVEVVTCLDGRSPRSRGLAEAAGVTSLPTLADVVSSSAFVVSVVPPGAALAAARSIEAAAAGSVPVVVDLNAVAPSTLAQVAAALAGFDLVDGSISGSPPRPGVPVRVYLCGPSAESFAAVPNALLDVVVLDGPVGSASALKMCTASMYKGTHALVMQALITADTYGVRDQFLADTAQAWPDDVPGWHTGVAIAASKAWRFVDEMHEIAATQRSAGLPDALFEGVAQAYERAARTPLGRTPLEDVDRSASVSAVLDGLRLPDSALPGSPLHGGAPLPFPPAARRVDLRSRAGGGKRAARGHF